MKLPPRSDLVKPDGTALKIAAVTVLVTVLAVQLILVVTDRQEARMDRFGNAAARVLAELAVEPLMRQDRMHLGVIGNRLADTAEISGVASYTSDNELLASTGEMQGPQYSRPVTIDESIVGYVRIAVHPPAFASADGARTLGLLLAVVLVPLLVAAGWTFAGAVWRGELAAASSRRSRESPVPRQTGTVSGGPDEPAGQTTTADVGPERPAMEAPHGIRHYLLAVNLYNQLTLEPTEREFELSLCIELAEAVAEIYQGQVVNLPGVGALVDFDHTEDEDRPFQILCAAFVLSRLLREETPFGHYRLGLNLTVRPADGALPLDDAAIDDAALLSALAKDATLAISAPYGEALEGEQRLVKRPLVNTLLDELTTSGPGCHLVTGLEAPFDALVMQQAEQLKSQRDATSSPSTF